MFRKSRVDNFYLYGTEVDNLFISDYMTEAKGEYLKAYLLALMSAQHGLPLDNDSLCMQLGMNREELEDCWTYWEERHVIKRVSDKYDESGRYHIEFINLRELAFGSRESTEERKENALDDRELKKLFKDVQVVTGRLISDDEMKEIISLTEDYEISPELIIYCYSYCVSKGKNAGKYAAKVVKDWKARGLETPEMAEAYLEGIDKRYADYRAVFRELGIGRNPSAEEKRMMNAWFAQGKSLNDILAACRKTVGIANPLKYLDKVLSSAETADAGSKEDVSAKVNRLYEDIRKKNTEEAAKRREEIFRKLPELSGLEAGIKKEMGEQMLAMTRRDAKAIELSKKKIASLRNEMETLLISAGYSAKALETAYSCEKCKDTGITEDGLTCSCYAEKLEMINGKR